MKISDLLRTLADKIEHKDDSTPLSMATGKKDSTDPSATSDKTTTMVPPLQQKLELMKKSAGIENTFDVSANDDKDHDDIKNLKKMAGISQHAVRTVGDENSSI